MKTVPSSATVPTPKSLAAAMVGALDDTDGAIWLDPCVGDGAFLEAMAARGIPAERTRGVELSVYRNVSSQALVNWEVDFLGWALDNPAIVDRIVMNPPYLALSRVRGPLLAAVGRFARYGGSSFPMTANYWSVFVRAALKCLRQHGQLTAVLPAAWDFAHYATELRALILKSFADVVVIRSAKPLFPTVQDGAIVLVARGFGSSSDLETRFGVDDRVAAEEALQAVAARTTGSNKVVRLFPQAASRVRVRLSDEVAIRIGAVTGDSVYFLLTEKERLARRLPVSALRPVLSRSRHLSTPVLGPKDWEHLRDTGERVWLLRPSCSSARKGPVKTDLARGRNGACVRSRFKIRSRKHWYQTPMPQGVHGFMSGMSAQLPFLVLRTMSNLSATNTLYVVTFRKRQTREERAAIGLALLGTEVRTQLRKKARVYGDGLLKFEPNDIASLEILLPLHRHRAISTFNRATRLLLAGEPTASAALADAWLSDDLPKRRPKKVAA